MTSDSGQLKERRRGQAKCEDAGIPAEESQSEKRVFVRKVGSGGLLSSQSVMVLVIGVLVGYVLLPMVLVETNSKALHQKSIAFDARSDASSGLRHLVDSGIQERLIEQQQVLSSQSLPTPSSPKVLKTAVLSDHRRKKILVTGGAGFVGSHLVDKLMMEGQEVIVVDNFFTGQKKNIAHWLHHPNFKYVIVTPMYLLAKLNEH
jgi:hypothetical protein